MFVLLGVLSLVSCRKEPMIEESATYSYKISRNTISRNMMVRFKNENDVMEERKFDLLTQDIKNGELAWVHSWTQKGKRPLYIQAIKPTYSGTVIVSIIRNGQVLAQDTIFPNEGNVTLEGIY